MENVIQISNVKPNTFEFDAQVQGLETNDMSVRFVIEAEGMEFAFPAVHQNGTKWEVNIPPLDVLKRTAYNFHIDLVTEGYHFEPLRGVVNVVGSPDIYVSKPASKVEPGAEAPKADIPTEKQKAAAPAAPEPVVPKNANSRSIEQIANDLMAKAKEKSSSDEMIASNTDEDAKKAEEKVAKKEEKKVEKAEAKDTKEEKLPSVKTPEPKELAKQHDVPLKDIEAQVKKGIEHEKEHTTDEVKAREIALDHIKEDPKYYDNLEKIEEGGNSKKVEDKTFSKKNKIISDTGEKPATNESAAAGSTASHDVQGGKPPKKEKSDKAKKILEEMAAAAPGTSGTSVKRPTKRAAPTKLKKIAKGNVVEGEEEILPKVKPEVGPEPVISEKEEKLKNILAETKEETKQVTTSPLKKRAVTIH